MEMTKVPASDTQSQGYPLQELIGKTVEKLERAVQTTYCA